MRRMRMLGLSATLALVSVAPLSGQDSHYWSEQYGTRANLLGGAVVGSVRDLSATYYNPGAIALIQDQGFILSARTYRRSEVTLEDAAGEGRDLSSASTRPIPTLLAGSLRFDWLGKSRLAYSLVTRQRFEVNLTGARIESRDVLAAPGSEQIATAFRGDVEVSDLWAGLTWSYPVSERVGLGVTAYYAGREQKLGSELLAQAATQAGDVGITTRLRERSLSHHRMLLKVGAGLNLGAVTVGVTATTPSVAISGGGRSVYNSSVAGLDIDGDDIPDPSLASDLQDDVTAEYRSPASLAAGAAASLGSSRLHASVEWFASQERYTLLGPDPFIGQTSGQPISNDLTGELASVLNWAVGIEHELGEQTALFASVSADKSAATSTEASDFVTTAYDITKVGGGAAFTVFDTEITLGVLWGGGSGPFPELIDLGRLDAPDDLLSGAEDGQVRFRQWTIVFGFELGR